MPRPCCIPLFRFWASHSARRAIGGQRRLFRKPNSGLPAERRHRTVPVPLRKLDYFEDYAILRDHSRKIEVLVDHQLLPLRWDPTWSRWRQLISATVEISADFVRTGRYRKRAGEWKLIESETALPSTAELTAPDSLEEDILRARTATRVLADTGSRSTVCAPTCRESLPNVMNCDGSVGMRVYQATLMSHRSTGARLRLVLPRASQ